MFLFIVLALVAGGYFYFKNSAQRKELAAGRSVAPESGTIVVQQPSCHPYGDGKWVETANPYHDISRDVVLGGNTLTFSPMFDDRADVPACPGRVVAHRKILINGVFKGNYYHSAYYDDATKKVVIRTRATNDFPKGERWTSSDGIIWTPLTPQLFASKL